TESVRLRRVHLKPSQSNFVASESSLSRDRVGFISTETKSDQSLSRASQHSTLDTTKNSLISGRPRLRSPTSTSRRLCSRSWVSSSHSPTSNGQPYKH
ncbi:hypothetical protein CR513_01971, partial [Mucuna pruriens]